MLSIIEVESAFRKYAVSRAGARGYMQVMPFWARLIGDGDVHRLFHLQTNLRFGCVIMRHYLDIERGNLFLALGRYNGSRGRSEYPDQVFAAQRRWESCFRTRGFRAARYVSAGCARSVRAACSSRGSTSCTAGGSRRC